MAYNFYVVRESGVNTLGMNITIFKVTNGTVTACETRYEFVSDLVCQTLNEKEVKLQ